MVQQRRCYALKLRKTAAAPEDSIPGQLAGIQKAHPMHYTIIFFIEKLKVPICLLILTLSDHIAKACKLTA